jgi:[ribosomal protein S5]-alanine N-acetyltransferase
MGILAETSHLIIRDWHPEEDAEQALQIYSDPEVTKFLITKADSIEKQVSILRRWAEKPIQPDDGTGLWAIVTKNIEEIIGTVILLKLLQNEKCVTQNYEIGWHLKKSAWGKGYATEAAKAILDYGFNRLNLPAIYAVVDPGNTASIRLTQRLGMNPIGRTSQYYGAELEMFKIEANAWRESLGNG